MWTLAPSDRPPPTTWDRLLYLAMIPVATGVSPLVLFGLAPRADDESVRPVVPASVVVVCLAGVLATWAFAWAHRMLAQAWALVPFALATLSFAGTTAAITVLDPGLEDTPHWYGVLLLLDALTLLLMPVLAALGGAVTAWQSRE